MTLEESAALDTANNTVKAPKANKTKKDAPEQSDLDKAAGITEEYFDEQGAKSKSNKSNGGSEVVVSLINKTLVRFTENFGFIKKGHEQEVSDVAYAIYDKKGVIVKL